VGGSTISMSDTRIEALQFQSSAYGVVIPVVYGVTRIPGNLIWYGGFKAKPNTITEGGKGGVQTQQTTYTYSASVAMGLCEGQISDIISIWRGKKYLQYVGPSSAIATAQETYTIVAGGTFTVSHAANFSANISVTVSVTVDVGDGGQAAQDLALSEGSDYVRVGGAYTFPASTPWAGRVAQVNYQWVSNTPGQSAMAQLGLTFKSGALGQAVWSNLTTNFPAQAVPYSGLAYVAGQDYDLGSGAQVENHNFEVAASLAFHLGSSAPDVDPALIVADLLPNQRYGANYPSTSLVLARWSTYCRAANLLVSPALTEQQSAAEILQSLADITNSAVVTSAGRVRIEPYGDVALTGNGATYTPNATPIYDLTDDHFIVSGTDLPVQKIPKALADANNHVQIEFLDRANQYNPAIAEAKDQANIEAYGLRSKDPISAHWICDAGIARNVAQLVLQRVLYVRNEYKFTLPANFALLEPMDLVTLTDALLGLSKTPVRIKQIEENGDGGDFDVVAEDYPPGVANSTLYPSQSGIGFAHNYNADPGNVATPLIFEAPVQRTTTGLEVYAAVSSSNPNWGGCQVWCSLDGTNYRLIGKVSGGARYGALTGAISGGNLPISLVSGALVSGSAADAGALTTLCYVGGASPEYLAFQTATLTGTLAYTLGGGLVRGAYGTAVAAHTAGDGFARIDDAIATSGPLDLSMIGKTIYFKFTSFNVYGGAQQSLASVPQYTYVITGAMAQLPPAQVTSLSATFEFNGIRIVWAPNTEPDLAAYELRVGASWNTATRIDRVLATTYLWAVQTAAAYTIWVAAIDALGNYGTPTSAVVSITGPGTVSGQRAEVVDNNVLLYWSAPAAGSLPIREYQVRKGATFAGGQIVGSNGNSTFTAIFEQASGTYTYWIAAVDTAGNIGTAVSIVATVNQPPDYVLRTNIDSAFGGTLSSVYLEGGALIGPVDLTKTWATHFSSQGWTSIQDQINAGLPIYAEPSSTAGSYEEAFDYGSILPATTITTTLTSTAIAGTVTITPLISYRRVANLTGTTAWTSGSATVTGTGTAFSTELAAGDKLVAPNGTTVTILSVGSNTSLTLTANYGGSTVSGQTTQMAWTDGPSGATSVLASNFRYFKVRFDLAAAAGANLVKITAINIKLSVKQRTDSGSGNAVSTDVGGTVVNFNIAFVQADSPVVQPIGTTAVIGMVDYTSVPNPTSFNVLLFDRASGSRVSGAFSWTARGY